MEVYGEVIRALVTENSTLGPNPEFGILYIRDRAMQGAADPQKESDSQSVALTRRVQRGIREKVEDLAKGSFVSDGDEIRFGPEHGAPGDRPAALITLGPIPDGSRKVEVGASLVVGDVAGVWLTYVVERDMTGSDVTATTGSIATV